MLVNTARRNYKISFLRLFSTRTESYQTIIRTNVQKPPIKLELDRAAFLSYRDQLSFVNQGK